MQIVSEKSSGTADRRLQILILQTVTVGVILVFAVVLRIFGGDFYSKVSRWYHARFDDITLSSEVLKPQNPVNTESEETDSGGEAAVTDDIEYVSRAETEETYGEEYDEALDSEVSGSLTESDSLKATAVSAETNTLLWPVMGRISSHYGYRTHPITGVYSMHNGLDIAADTGTPIKAAFDGEVVATGYSESYGYYCMISHNGSMKTLYAHCSKLIAEEGESVKKGDTVALVGSTGRSTGAHLHFEVRVGSYRIDPEWLLSRVVGV